MATKILGGNNTPNEPNVDSNYRLETTTEKNVTLNPNNVGGVKNYSENDDGTVMGTAFLLSPEVDADYRLRVSQDTILDTETFNYSAQNTGKHTYTNSVMTNVWSGAGMRTNGAASTAQNAGTTFGTYAMFPIIGSINGYCEVEGSFDAQPTTNTIIDFGLFQRGVATAYAPVDGIYFRLTSAGMQGVINSNGTETNTGIFVSTFGGAAWSYVSNKKYQFIIVFNERDVEFWIDDQLYGRIDTPSGQGQPFLSAALPFSIRHAIIGGAAGAALSFYLNDYTITMGGGNISDDFGTLGNRIYGSYQGLGGGTMGSLASYANSTNPTAAVPTNTTSTVLTALGGQGWETDTLAVTTDGIIMSYQVPLGTVLIQGKRLKLTGFKLSSYVQTTLVGGGYNAQFSLAFGHTAVSLATAESQNTKAPRRIALGSYSVPSVAAALVQLPDITIDLTGSPIYINPGEFICIAKKKIGTAPSAGVIAYTFTPIYSWE